MAYFACDILKMISLKLSAVKSILATVLFYLILLAEVNNLNITLFFFEGVVVFIKKLGLQWW